MPKKVTDEMRRLVQAELGRAGGKARARKHSKKQLREWAKLGGRPRKNGNAQGGKK